ncbi:MAG: two-component sensor histidine kinase [Crocinitomicaceae bacterium]|jgi:two-component sensor histidine kinase
MIKPLIPLNEAERLESLASYEILDTLPEYDFENVAILAAEILNTPISAVSLVDGKRQWSKSIFGTTIKQAPRELSFCGHAILKPDEVLIIPDSREDERFKDNPIVIGEPKIVFYAGAPLVDSNGLSLGTLCVIDKVPHHPKKRQIEALTALSNQVVSLMELRKSILELKNSNAQLEIDSKRKSALLNDIHHRINNHLQIVSSMLSMHCDNEEEERIRSVFKDAQGKIASIALIHEKMYHSGEIGTDSIEDHLNTLIGDMIELYEVKNITTDVQIEKLALSLETIVPLGLLINEIIANALKYAFVGRDSGKLTLHLKKYDEDYHELIIGDDGVGMPRESIGLEMDRLGRELIGIFAAQLGGELVRLDGEGTMFSLKIKKIKSDF